MIKVKIGRQTQDLIRLAYNANRSVLLFGHTGTGKSEILAKAAHELHVDHIALDLSIMEPADLSGLPVVDKGLTGYAPPALLPRSGRGILVLEELNRAERFMQAPALQLLTARRLNGYILPKGWVPAASVNPSDEGGYIVNELDPALLARFLIVNVEPDVRNWLTWAQENNIHPAVQRYVREAKDIFNPAKSNPRSWRYVSDVLYSFESGKRHKGKRHRDSHEEGTYQRNTLLAAIAGEVGDKLAVPFLRTYRGNGTGGVPSGDVVVGAYSKARPWIRKMAKAGNSAALESVCHGVLLHLQDPANEEKTRSSTRQTANLRKLVDDLPAEFKEKVLGPHPWIKKSSRRRKGKR